MSVLKTIGMEDWYALCQDQERLFNLCAVDIDEVVHCKDENTRTANIASQDRNFFCICGRCFRQQRDLHKHCHFCDVSGYSKGCAYHGACCSGRLSRLKV